MVQEIDEKQAREMGFGPQIKKKPAIPGRDGHNKRINTNTMGSLLQQQGQGNVAKELIHPGDDVVEMLMRTNLLDVNEVRDVALTLAKCDEFGMEEDKNLILYLLAARNSINGRGQLEYLMGITGVLSPSMLGFRGKPNDNKKRYVDGEPE